MIRNIADQLIDLRVAQDLTQEELAEKAGTSPTTISNLESGKVIKPQYRTLRKVAAALGVDVEELMTPKGGAPEQHETFVDRLLRAPTMPIEELSDEDLKDIRRVLAGGKPGARFVEEDPEFISKLAAHLIEENLRLKEEMSQTT